MNSFFYDLGKRTANTQDALVSSTCGLCDSIADAAQSFAQGYSEQRTVNNTPPLYEVRAA